MVQNHGKLGRMESGKCKIQLISFRKIIKFDVTSIFKKSAKCFLVSTHYEIFLKKHTILIVFNRFDTLPANCLKWTCSYQFEQYHLTLICVATIVLLTEKCRS